MAVNLSFIGGAGWQFFDNNGKPLTGGKIYTYAAGTTTPQTTFTSRTGLIANANPIILDSAGRTPAQIWSTEGLLYKYVVTDANDVQIRAWDNIGGSVVASDLAANLAASSGSSLVGFVQTGTGAATQTVQSKLRQTISIKDYGGVGDATTDDTTAIQNALTAAAALDLALLVDGQFKFTAQLTIPKSIRVYGTGDNSDATLGVLAPSALVKDFNGDGIVLQDDAMLQDLEVHNISGNTGDNIVMSGSRTKCARVTSSGAGQDGFRVGSDTVGANANVWFLNNCIAFNNTRHGLYVHDGVGATDANAGNCDTFDARSNGGDGIKCDSCTWNTFINPVCQANTGYGFRITSAARSITVVGGDLEANTAGQGVIESGSLSHIIIGPMYSSGSTWVDSSGYPERNVLMQYSAGAAAMLYGAQISLNDPAASGRPKINFFSDTAETNSAYIEAQQTGTNGGQLNVRTKRDGGLLTAALKVDALQRLSCEAGFVEALPILTYGTTVNIDAALGNQFQLNVTNLVAFTIAAPTNPATGQVITIMVRNTAGSVMGAITWDAVFKLAAWVNPGGGNSRSITFRYDGANWVEINRTTADVPN